MAGFVCSRALQSLELPEHPLSWRYLDSYGDPEMQNDQRTRGNTPSNGADPETEHPVRRLPQWGYLEGDLDPLRLVRPTTSFSSCRSKASTPVKPAPYYSSTHRRKVTAIIYNPDTRRASILRADEIASRGFRFQKPTSHPRSAHPRRASRASHAAAYLQQQAFSLEGVTALIRWSMNFWPGLGATELVMGVSHRSHLDVIAQVAKPTSEDENITSFEDVKRHHVTQLWRRGIPHGRDRRVRRSGDEVIRMTQIQPPSKPSIRDQSATPAPEQNHTAKAGSGRTPLPRARRCRLPQDKRILAETMTTPTLRWLHRQRHYADGRQFPRISDHWSRHQHTRRLHRPCASRSPSSTLQPEKM